jgi:hypothetical protein
VHRHRKPNAQQLEQREGATLSSETLSSASDAVPGDRVCSSSADAAGSSAPDAVAPLMHASTTEEGSRNRPSPPGPARETANETRGADFDRASTKDAVTWEDLE